MTSPDWPALPFPEWERTCDTVHLWTQIVGKTRMALGPLENHWWNVPLYVTACGLTTSAVPCGERSFDAEFDFIRHELRIRTSDGQQRRLGLYDRSVADFYAEYCSALDALGIQVKIHTVPAEFDDLTPFEQDRHHASYDREYVERFRQILIRADCVLKEFRARFIGKSSPVHFFWGSFDLAVTRFSGRVAPARPNVDPITREAYSHEVISCGFWPGDRRYPQPAFYAYAAPPPPGFDTEPVKPAAAGWNTQLGEYILNYEDVRSAPSPEQAMLDFCESTYEAGATLGDWDRAGLERR